MCRGIGIGWEGGEGPERAWGGGGWREVWMGNEEVRGGVRRGGRWGPVTERRREEVCQVYAGNDGYRMVWVS